MFYIDAISNYSGALHLKEEKGKFFLQMQDTTNGVDDIDPDEWIGISLALFSALGAFQAERDEVANQSADPDEASGHGSDAFAYAIQKNGYRDNFRPLEDDKRTTEAKESSNTTFLGYGTQDPRKAADVRNGYRDNFRPLEDDKQTTEAEDIPLDPPLQVKSEYSAVCGYCNRPTVKAPEDAFCIWHEVPADAFGNTVYKSTCGAPFGIGEGKKFSHCPKCDKQIKLQNLPVKN